MGNFPEQFVHRLLSGDDRTLWASLLRGGLRAAELPYSSLMFARNLFYDSHLFPAHRLPIPVISVGNITAGGTGKTPLVRWLALHLQQLGLRPGVLLRGYRRTHSQISDEAILLQEDLNLNPDHPIPVHTNPDRVAGAREILATHQNINLLLLDDGFQHRRLARDFDLVLIDATNPFGYGHVHPRGLLREPLRGLRRAEAFVLTRTDLVSVPCRQEIESLLRACNHTAPVYRARHVHTGLRVAAGADGGARDLPLNDLAPHRFFAAAGIANPEGLALQLRSLPGQYTGHHWFSDHHDYLESDLADLRRMALAAEADTILVTEKDWVKIRQLPSAPGHSPPIWRLRLEIKMDPQAEQGLLALIQTRIERTTVPVQTP